MKKVLFAWIGNTDQKAAKGDNSVGLGPIGQAVDSLKFDQVVLICNQPENEYSEYEKWLKRRTKAGIEIFHQPLSRPTHYEEIYKAAGHVVDSALKKFGAGSHLTFHLSPGTPAMAAVWIILAKSRYNAELIETSPQDGLRHVRIPFEIAAEFVPDLLRESDRKITERAASETIAEDGFGQMIFRSAAMRKLVERAKKVAIRSVPVLIEGESGSGKELLARAIHEASPRSKANFVAVNCGAIPLELVESELFGHVKGSFTGATANRAGYFEEADKGTLFLDEIGELPLNAQVKLLRVLQEGEVTRVGANKSKKVDVRVLSATNRSLLKEVSEGRFREDLFYRLAVIVLNIPPLRGREGDLGLLIDRFWSRLNEDAAELGIRQKKLSTGARSALLKHSWTGNVRELQNTLTRIAITSDVESVSKADVESALLVPLQNQKTDLLNRAIGNGFSLQTLVGEVAKHYLEQALIQTSNNKTAAAELLGLGSYQTLKNWMKKYGLSID